MLQNRAKGCLCPGARFYCSNEPPLHCRNKDVTLNGRDPGIGWFLQAPAGILSCLFGVRGGDSGSASGSLVPRFYWMCPLYVGIGVLQKVKPSFVDFSMCLHFSFSTQQSTTRRGHGYTFRATFTTRHREPHRHIRCARYRYKAVRREEQQAGLPAMSSPEGVKVRESLFSTSSDRACTFSHHADDAGIDIDGGARQENPSNLLQGRQGRHDRSPQARAGITARTACPPAAGWKSGRGRPWRSTFARKPATAQRVIIRAPWTSPVAAYHLAALHVR